MKKTNLKKRLDELRNEPAPPVEILLHLNADLLRRLRHLAIQDHLSVESYIVSVLSKDIDRGSDGEVG
jgi:hypothetical protein